MAGKARLSFLPTHRAQWLRLSGGPRGLLRLLHALDRGAGAGRKLLQQKLNTSSFWCSPSGPGCEVVETFLTLGMGRQLKKAASFLAQQFTGPQPTRSHVVHHSGESLCAQRRGEQSSTPAASFTITNISASAGSGDCIFFFATILQGSRKTGKAWKFEN